MARKPVQSYAIFHSVGGTTSLAVYYAAGGNDLISGIPVAEAMYIVDFLRNEKPMDYDHAIKKFMSGAVEPVGEGE